MKSFFNKTEFTLTDIESLINNKAEEGIHLEFKDSRAFFKLQQGQKDCRPEIGKDVSAFANSDGGILIYGLSEDNNRQASTISFIDSVIYSKDWLQQVIDGNIERPVQDILIHPIQNPNKSTEQIYVVQIPESANAPHMAKDRKFYRRNNQGNVIMDEYEVRRLYNQTGRTNLEIIDVKGGEAHSNTVNYNFGSSNKPIDILCLLNLDVQNTGNTIEHHYKLETHIPASLIYSHTGLPLIINESFQRNEAGTSIHSFGNKKPVFQNEINRVVSIPLRVSGNQLSLLEEEILLKLYYSSGIKEKRITLKELFTYNAQPITSDTFQ